MADEVVEIADGGTNDYIEKERPDGSKYMALDAQHVQRSRLRVDTCKWLLAKALPRIYGDKVTAGLTGRDSGPIETAERRPLELTCGVAFLLTTARRRTGEGA